MKHVNNFVQFKKQDFKTYVNAFLPESAIVPLLQSGKGKFETSVKPGDKIKEGQVISKEEDGMANHSPLPGTVESIVECNCPDGSLREAACIKLGGSFSYLGKRKVGCEWKHLSDEEILKKIRDKGIINTFYGAESLYAQIKNCRIKKDRYLVVRLFDDDPSICTDEFISSNFQMQVIEGAVAVAKSMNAEGIIFADKKNVTENFNIKGVEFPHALLAVDLSRYPNGKLQDLVQAVKKSTEPSVIKFAGINRRSIFIDSMTALSAYNCVEYEHPVVEQFVQIGGTCLNSVAMFKVRIGTTVRSLVEQCGGFIKNPAKIIINGLINGVEINSLDVPVTKTVKSIIFLTASELQDQNRTVCIRCGKCRQICPEGLQPDLIYSRPNNTMIAETSVLCSSCNLCNSVCPSRISLSQTISLLRLKYES